MIYTKVKSTKVITDQKRVAYIENLILSFKNRNNPNESNLVIRNVNFELFEGEVHAIIGESGSGKSVLSSTLFGLAGQDSYIESGKVVVDDIEVQKFTLKKWEKSKMRGKIVTAVFQNPMTTLNPTMKIGKQIIEGILINKIVNSRKEAKKIAIDYLTKTRIKNPKIIMKMYPHQLSGGMKQRVVISAIIACNPKIIIFDEPTTALDPTIQAEILEIIKDLIHKTKMSVIFITHDLGVVASISNRISIMYAGQIIETGKTNEILLNPQHPYTWGLLLSMPDVNHGEKLNVIEGAVPSNLNHIKGDAFAPRNVYAMGIDYEEEPPYFKLSETHFAKTWLLDQNAASYQPPKIIKKRWDKFAKNEVNNE